MSDFKVLDVSESIQTRKSVYMSVIQRVFNVNEDLANHIFYMELECFVERLKKYYIDSTTSSRPFTPTLTVLQGTNIFLEVLTMGLSFSKGKDLVYLSRLTGTGTAVGYDITVRGRIFRAIKAGSIKYISEPIIVRENDKFFLKTNELGVQVPHHEVTEFNKDFSFEKDFKLAYCFITHANNDKTLSIIDKAQMLNSYEKSNNKHIFNQQNMLRAKCIKNALKNINSNEFDYFASKIDDDDDDDTNINIDLTTDEVETEQDDVINSENDAIPENKLDDDLFNLNFDL